jgi:BirA family biotin operon repressor/biotin-[acetyl-CoA-carboxylase] ligase
MGYGAFLQALVEALAAPAAPASRPGLPRSPSQDLRGNLLVVRRIASTQSLARRIAREYAQEELEVPALTLVAYEQSAGRGRQGRSWMSPAGGGIYVTLIRSLADSRRVAQLPLLAAVALARGLDRYLPQPCGLRWPNDLMVAGRKVGGVLIDAFSRPGGSARVLLGFGVNGRGPAPLEIATAVADHAPAAPPPGALAGELIRSVEADLMRLAGEEDLGWLVEDYRRASLHRVGETLRCRCGGAVYRGTFQGFDDAGHLLLATAQGWKTLAAGEIAAEEEALESG